MSAAPAGAAASPHPPSPPPPPFTPVPDSAPPPALSQIRVGTEVEFCKTKDARSGKEAATRVVLLPAGTVSFEVALPTRYEGVVVTSAHAAASA